MLSLFHINTPDSINLYGSIHKVKSSKKPLVIIAHGYFSSNRIGPHRLYYQIADALEHVGYNVVRFDLRGIGESEGNIENVTFANHVSDLEYVINEFHQRFYKSPIILIAHCIGCNVSLPIIKNNKNIFKKVIFISPYFTTASTLNNFFNDKQQIELREKGYAYRKGIYADYTFFSGINEYPVFVNNINCISDITTIISAEKDQFIPIAEIEKLYNEIAQDKIIIPEADHNYIEMNARKALIKTIGQIIEENEEIY